MCYVKLKGKYYKGVFVFTAILTLIGFFASFLSLLDTIGVI